jgi:hypothetical protein
MVYCTVPYLSGGNWRQGSNDRIRGKIVGNALVTAIQIVVIVPTGTNSKSVSASLALIILTFLQTNYDGKSFNLPLSPEAELSRSVDKAHTQGRRHWQVWHGKRASFTCMKSSPQLTSLGM